MTLEEAENTSKFLQGETWKLIEARLIARMDELNDLSTVDTTASDEILARQVQARISAQHMLREFLEEIGILREPKREQVRTYR